MPTTARRGVHFEVHGRGEPLLAITGFGLPGSMLAVLSQPGSGIRMITYDHPGIGRSQAGRTTFTIGGLARAALEVLDTLDLPQAHVAGLSLGGAVALELALRKPGRVRSLILMGTSAGAPWQRHQSVAGLSRIACLVARGSLERRRLWFGATLYSPDYVRGRAKRLASRTRHAEPSMEVLIGQAVAASLHSRLHRLRAVKVPTLVVHGEEDVLLPVANAYDLARGIPGAELEILPGAGHGFMLERPAETARLLAAWTARNPISTP